MKIRLDVRKTVWQNATDYFDKAKQARAKASGARKAIIQTEARLEKMRREDAAARASAAEEAAAARARFKIKPLREREWFERYRFFKTSGGFLVIAGKDAKQNEDVVAHRLEDADLFLHADVHGAPATILKNGVAAGEQDAREAAQWASSYSSAWKAGSGACDAYAVKREQVSKYSHGEFVAKGAFVIRGTRQWFKNTELALAIAKNADGFVIALPAVHAGAPRNAVRVKPGVTKKSEAAKRIAARLATETSEVEKLLPGDCEIV
ncbi:MAG: NFACT RNA binding domain-containing protein [Candidatus Micrarchaeota archaeon]